jgi:hypothetical protein
MNFSKRPIVRGIWHIDRDAELEIMPAIADAAICIDLSQDNGREF